MKLALISFLIFRAQHPEIGIYVQLLKAERVYQYLSNLFIKTSSLQISLQMSYYELGPDRTIY